jgi:hypothetical protein
MRIAIRKVRSTILDGANDFVLFAAATDVMFLCKNRVPSEAWSFFCWYYALYWHDRQLSSSPPFDNDTHEALAAISYKWFRGLREKSRAEQKRRGKELMLATLRDPRKLAGLLTEAKCSFGRTKHRILPQFAHRSGVTLSCHQAKAGQRSRAKACKPRVGRGGVPSPQGD